MSNYDLYIKRLKNKYNVNNATYSLGLSDTDIDRQTSMKVSELQRQQLMKENQTANPEVFTTNNVKKSNLSYSEQAEQNKIEWADNYEEESLNWWERVGAYLAQTFDTLKKGVYKGMVEGIVDLGASAVGNVAGWFGNEELKQNMSDFVARDLTEETFNQEWMKQARRFTNPTWLFGSFDGNGYNFGQKALDFSYNDKATDDFTKKIAQGVASSLTFAGYTPLGPVGWGLALGSVAGSSTEEALNDGATLEKATAYGLTSAAIEGATEALVGKVLNVMGKGASKAANKLFGTNISGRLANETIGGIVGKQYGKSIALNMLKEFNEEGLEEVVSDLLDPIAKMWYKECDNGNFGDKYTRFFEENGGFQGLLESYFYGGMSAAISGGANTVARISKYGSIKAVQFENSIANVTELNAEIQEQLDKNDITKYPNPADNPKIAELLRKKEYLREKIGEDFKEWLDNVKEEYDEATSKVVEGKQLTAREIRNLKKAGLKEGLRQAGEYTTNSTIEDLQQDLGEKTTNKLGYEYRKTENVNMTNLSKKIVYVNGKQTFKEYVKSVIHEIKHVGDNGLNKSTLTDEIIKGMSKEAYDEEFERQSILEGDVYFKTDEGKDFLKSKNLTLDKYNDLSDEKKIELKKEAAIANPEFFNEEVAAEHLIDYFANFKEFNRVIDGVSQKGIRKLLNTFRKAFANTSNKPANYNDVIKALQDGLKAERKAAAKITSDNVKYRETEKKFGNFEKTLQKSKQNDIIDVKEVEENDFKRLQEQSKRLLKRFENTTTTYRELDERVRERYTRGIRERLATNRNSNANVNEFTLKSASKGTTFKIYSNVDTKLFYDAFSTIKPYLAQNELVDLHKKKEYKGCKCYLSEDGLQGFAIEPDGNLISAFNADTNKRGYIEAIKDFVIEQGGTHLDCYGYLAKYYTKALGFHIAATMDYNMEYDHHNIAERHNMPEISFLVKNEVSEVKHFDKDSYDEAKAYQMKNIAENTNKDKVKHRITEDSKGRSLTEQQQKLFKDVSDEMLDENGRLITVYHGTTNAGFTVFNPQGSKNYKYGNNFAAFFTDSETMAKSYGNGGTKRAVYNWSPKKISLENLQSKIKDYLNDSTSRYKNIEIKKKNDGYYYEITYKDGQDKRSFGSYGEGNYYTEYEDENGKTFKEFVPVEEFEDLNSLANDLGNIIERELIYDSNEEYFNDTPGNIYECYLNLKNPFIVENSFRWDIIPNPFNKNNDGSDLVDTNYIVNKVLEQGKYDGVIFKNIIDYGANLTEYEEEFVSSSDATSQANVYVVFKPNQIKAVDNPNPTEEKDDIRFRITGNEDFDKVVNADNYTKNENTQHDLFSRNNDDFLMIQNKLTQFDTEQYDDDFEGEGIDVQDILKDIKKYIQKTTNEYYKPLKEELTKSNYDAQKIVDLNYNYTNRIRDLLENYDDWMDVAEDQADDKWLEDIDKKLNKIISDFSKIRESVNKLDIKNKPNLIHTANPELLDELNDNLERYNNVGEEYKNRRDVLEAKLTKKKVDIKKFKNTAIQLEKPIKEVLDNVKIDKPFAKESTKTRYYNEVVAPFDTLIEQYKITLRDVKISDEDIETAVNYLINDMLGGRHYRNARLKKIDFIREQYDNLSLSPQEIVNTVVNSQPVNTNNAPAERVRFINNSRKVATPDMAGIKAQADLRKDGKVYTLTSVMNLTKAVESSLRNEPTLQGKEPTIDYEGSTRELKSLEIAMILNEYNNTQYVKEESKQINYSGLTNTEKVDKITDTIVKGITLKVDGNIVRLNALVEANDRMGIILQEYIRGQVENLVNNEGNVSKITKVLERQEKAFKERLNALKERNTTLTNKILSLETKVEEEKRKGKEKNKELIKKYNDEIKKLKKEASKEVGDLRKELRTANRKIDTLVEKAQRQEELKRKYQRKNMELYTDNRGVKKLKVEDIETLNELGRNINPDFKMSAYVENQIVQRVARGDFDGAVDLYMNAILNSEYVDGDEAKPYSYFIGDYAYGDDLILEDGATFENDIMELRNEMIEIFKGAEISTRQKFIDKLANMATYNHNLRERLRETKTTLVVYRRGIRAANTGRRVYKKVIDIDKNGGSKSGNRLAGTSPKWVEAILNFVQGANDTLPLNKITPEAILRGEHRKGLENLLKAYKQLERDGEVEFGMPIELETYIDYLLDPDVEVNGKYVEVYKRVLNGINRLIESEIGERKITFGNITGSIASVSRRMQEENRIKEGEKEETFRFTQGFLTPFAVVDKLAKYQEEAVIRQIYEELFNAEMKREEADIKLREPFIKFRENNKKVAKSFFKSLGKDVEITYGNGKKLTTNKSKLFSLYEAFKREQARGHITNKFGGIEVGNKVYQFETFEELQSLVNAIEKEFNLNNSKSVNSQYLKACEKFFELAREYKKQVDMERLGFSNVEDGFYFPIAIANADAQAKISSEDFFKTNMPGTANYSWNQNTTGNMGAIKLLDIEDIIERHSRQTANYAGYGVVADNVRKIWNYKLEKGKSVRNAMLSRFVDGDGLKVERYIARLMNDIQGIGQGTGSNTDTLFNKIVSKLRGNVAKVALGANPKVMLSQTASIPAAMRYIKGRYLLQAMTMRLKNVPEKPAMLLYRENHELVGQAETQGAIDKVGSVFTKGINFFDKVAIDNIWKACLLQTKKNGKWDVEAATKLAQKTVFDTQPNYLSLGRSEFLRSKNDFVKLFTMFQSQAQQNLSMAYDSINKIIYKKRHKLPITPEDWSDLGHALAALFIQALVYTGMGQLFSHIVKNDWKDIGVEKSASDFGIAMINDNLLGMIPIINNLEVDLEKEWKFNFDKLGSGFIDNYVDIIQNFEGFDKMSMQDWNTALSYTFGLPGTNIYKWTKAFGQYIPGAEDYLDEVDTFYKGKKITKATVTNSTTKTTTRKNYRMFSKNNGLEATTITKLYNLYSKGYTEAIGAAIPEEITVNGVKTSVDKEKYLSVYKNVNNAITKITSDINYSKYTEEQQAKMLSKVISIYSSASRKSISGENLNTLEQLAILDKSVDAKTLWAIIEASDLEADEKATRKDKITKYINKLKLSKANKYFIYAALGYSVDSNLYREYLTKKLRITSRQYKKLFSK